MYPTETIPGLKSKNIEFFSDTGKDLFMVTEGNLVPFSDFGDDVISLLSRELYSDPEALKCLKDIKYPIDRIKQFGICRYGAFTKNPDFNSNRKKLKEREYFDCGARGNCPFDGEGKVCQEIIVNNLVITRQEIHVIKLIAEDLTDIEIADRLFISPHTAIKHRQNIKEKLGLKKAGVAAWAVKNQLV